MESIKEKSFELFPEIQTDSNEWYVIEEQCDRNEQRKAFVKGAYYVLGEILDKTSKCITVKDAYEAFLECVEQLKK